MGDWLAGFGSDLGGAPRAPRPRTAVTTPATDTWTKGKSRVVKEVACCPDCGDLRVKIRTTKGAVVHMICGKCGFRWKDSRVARLSWGTQPHKRSC